MPDPAQIQGSAMWLIIGPNQCCGCAKPVFLGAYPTEPEARAAFARIVAELSTIDYSGTKIIRVAGQAVEDWAEGADVVLEDER